MCGYTLIIVVQPRRGRVEGVEESEEIEEILYIYIYKVIENMWFSMFGFDCMAGATLQ